MTFELRHLDVRFDLGGGQSFSGTSSNTATVTGRRVSAAIQNAGSPSLEEASIRIWGLSLSLMNQLSRLGKPLTWVGQNSITLMESSGSDAPAKVFSGGIISSYADFSDPPNVSLNVYAMSAALATVKPVEPISIKGPADVAAIMGQIAASMNLRLQNQGVLAKLPTCYFTGSAVDQMRACAKAANINADVDDTTLYIWPKGSSKNSGAAPLISPATGLIGYPEYTDVGANFRCLYQPGITFGSTIEVDTSLEPAKGKWYVLGKSADLESEMPGGKWFMMLNCARLGLQSVGDG